MTHELQAHDLPERLSRVHMVGIGGVGMSGVARILLARGGQVSGSDARESRSVLALQARGAAISIGHAAEALDLLPGGPTVVVTTHAAIPKTNPELVEAQRRGIPVILRPEVLAELMTGYRTVLVAGTHGKTSTTSMTVVALQAATADPSFAIGGDLNESGTNAHHGSGDIFVAEADESDASFLQYRADVAIVTNVEPDHLDFFGTEHAYVGVFDRFLDRIEPGGALVVCLDDPGARALAERGIARLAARGVTVLGYGGEAAGAVPLAARLVGYRPDGDRAVAMVELADGAAVTLALQIPGKHMALNAIAAFLAARWVNPGADPALLSGIADFGGVHRRYQLRGERGGVKVVDDYAHHPTEIRAVLTAARAANPDGRLIAVFQPHLYSRTESFAAEFGAALGLADEVVVLDVYGAREEPIPGVNGQLVAAAVPPERSGVHYVPLLTDVPDVVAGLALSGDLVLTLGAGDITMLGPLILDALVERGRVAEEG